MSLPKYNDFYLKAVGVHGDPTLYKPTTPSQVCRVLLKDGTVATFDKEGLDRMEESVRRQIVGKAWIKNDSAEHIVKQRQYDLIYDAVNTLTNELFMAEIKSHFGLSDDLFDACWSESYDRHHSGGHDEVANGMHSIVEFAEKILALKA